MKTVLYRGYPGSTSFGVGARLPYACCLAMFLIIFFVANTAVADAAMTTVSYRGIRPTDPMGRCGLPNPERGWRIETLIAEQDGASDVWGPAGHLRERLPAVYSEDWWIMDARQYRPFGLTLAQTYCYLDKFMDKPLSDEKLALLQRSFDNLRANGLKALLRFAYEKEMGQAEGPTLETILQHMDQLAPVIQANLDVIYVWQAGFVGAWGEWHSSARKLEQDYDGLAKIMAKLLTILPPDYMTQVRVPKYKRQALEAAPLRAYQLLSVETAFSAIPAARIGFHNDGFLAGKTCGGTWTEPPNFSSPGNPEFDYMTQESMFVPVDGELFWADIDGRVDGWKAAERMRLHHYASFSLAHSYSEREGNRLGMDVWMETPITMEQLLRAGMPLSKDYFVDGNGQPVTRTQFEYIRDHLGYRIELQEASFAREIPKKGNCNITVSLINRGFSVPHLPRPVEFAFINPSGKVWAVPVAGADVRTWRPHFPGDATYAPVVHTLSFEGALPEDMPEGQYALGLWLPDRSERLRTRPEYAMRTANGDVPFWSTPGGAYGINLLGRIEVLPEN